MTERASERDAIVRYLRGMAQTYRDYHTNADVVLPVATEIEGLATEIAQESHSEFRRENEGHFDLVDGMVLAKLADQRDELRAVLAPLLANPFVAHAQCYFCGCFETEAHGPACPLWRRDQLLGRSP